MSFMIKGLPAATFERYFAMTDSELAEHFGQRMTVTSQPGFPCRISLEDAGIGEEVLLLHHQHQTAATPYRASHAIFVRRQATEARLACGEVPGNLAHRLLSLRAFDDAHMMCAADVIAGTQLAHALTKLFADGKVLYIHIHNAKQGCYHARADRA